MKKALSITVAGTLFIIEEDAYNVLDSYLKSVQAHFGSDPDKAEIVKDIEARIAEQLMERKGDNGIVTIEAVNAMIAVMGTVEDFGELGADFDAPRPAYSAKRKLYRNPDDVVVAGVCSGVAAYFGLDPLWVRLGFAALVLLGFGTGIIIYIIMALIVPKAVTPAEKLQMKGGPVTLNSFKESVDSQIEHVKSKSSGLRTFFEKLLGLFGRIVRGILKIARWVVGLGFFGGALFATIALTFALVNLAFNASSAFVRFPVAEVASTPVYYSFVFLAYILFLVPIIFIGAAGLSIIKKRKLIRLGWAVSVGALWIVALIIFGSLMVRQAPLISERIEAMPQYQTVSRDVDVEDFTKLELHGSAQVHLVEGDVVSVSESGTVEDLDRTTFVVEDGVLVISQGSRHNSCLFCFSHKDVEVTITAPKIDSIVASDSVDVSVDSVDFGTLALEAIDASRIEMSGTASDVRIEARDVARVLAFELTTQTASVEAHDVARVELNVAKTLKAAAHDIARITYNGAAKVTKTISDAARIEARMPVSSTSAAEDSSSY